MRRHAECSKRADVIDPDRPCANHYSVSLSAATAPTTDGTPEMYKTLWSYIALLVLAMAGSGCIYGIESANPNSLTFLANSPAPYTPPGVTAPTGTSNCTSKCIAMEYEMWFGNNLGKTDWTSGLWNLRWGTPLLGTYNSTDLDIIDKHAEWFNDLGIDFLINDWSNSSANTAGGDPNVDIDLRASTDALFAEYEKLSQEGKPHPRIAILVGLMDEGDVTQAKVLSSGAHQNEADYIYQQYVQKYPDIYYFLDGKPLLTVFTLYSGDPGWRDSRFTVRIMSADIESQPFLLSAAQNGSNTTWSWIDRDPQPSYNNGAVEAMTVTQAYPGCTGWTTSGCPFLTTTGVPMMRGRDGTQALTPSASITTTFSTQWNKAISYDPRIIILTQWNEFIANGNPPSSSDEYTTNLSNDIEPTAELGYGPMAAVQQAIAKWRKAGR